MLIYLDLLALRLVSTLSAPFVGSSISFPSGINFPSAFKDT